MAVDPAAILAQLGFTDADSIAPVTGGADTLIWRVAYEGRSYALRLFRADQQEGAAHEAIAMRSAAGAIPVPAIIAQGEWQDRPVVLLEWCEGQPLAHALFQHPDKIDALGREFGRMHARIHQIPPPQEFAARPSAIDMLAQFDPELAQ